MKVRCKYNTGEDLRVFENKPLNKNELGEIWRYGAYQI